MIAEKHATGLMQQGLVFATTGFEMLNNRIGLLALDGWAKEVSEDISRFDPALSALYRKHFKTIGISPELDLMIGLGGSAISHHVRHRSVSSAPETIHITTPTPPGATNRPVLGDDDEDIPAIFRN